MQNQEDITQQFALLETYRLTLHHYVMQQAKLGTAFMPPGVTHGIREARENIKRIKQNLRKRGVLVEDHPNDEDIDEYISTKDTPSFAKERPTVKPNKGISNNTTILALQQQLQELDRILREAEFDQNINSTNNKFLRWKEYTSNVIKQSINETEALRLSTISPHSSLKGRQPRLISEARLCRSYIEALIYKYS